MNNIWQLVKPEFKGLPAYSQLGTLTNGQTASVFLTRTNNNKTYVYHVTMKYANQLKKMQKW